MSAAFHQREDGEAWLPWPWASSTASPGWGHGIRCCQRSGLGFRGTSHPATWPCVFCSTGRPAASGTALSERGAGLPLTSPLTSVPFCFQRREQGACRKLCCWLVPARTWATAVWETGPESPPSPCGVRGQGQAFFPSKFLGFDSQKRCQTTLTGRVRCRALTCTGSLFQPKLKYTSHTARARSRTQTLHADGERRNFQSRAGFSIRPLRDPFFDVLCLPQSLWGWFKPRFLVQPRWAHTALVPEECSPFIIQTVLVFRAAEARRAGSVRL